MRAGLALSVLGERIGLAWATPASVELGGDDTAGVELANDGSVTRVISAEEPGDVGDGFQPQFVRVFPILTPRNAIGLSTDGWQSTDSQRAVRCGDYVAEADVAYLESASHPMPANSAEAVDAGASSRTQHAPVFFCRTLGDTRTFLLGIRGDRATDGTLAPRFEIVAGRRGSEFERSNTGWSLPIEPAIRVAPTTDALRDHYALEGVTAVAVPGAGYATAFRYRRRLMVGWLRDDLHSSGALTRVTTLGGEPGKPALAWNGREVLLVFADRGVAANGPAGQPRPPAPSYTLRAVRFGPGETPAQPARVATTTEAMEHEFAPSAAALPDGGWVITWSQGPLEAQATAMQNVVVRRYAPDLTAVGDAVTLDVGDNASDSRVVTFGSRFLIAMLTGRHQSARAVTTVLGVCP